MHPIESGCHCSVYRSLFTVLNFHSGGFCDMTRAAFQLLYSCSFVWKNQYCVNGINGNRYPDITDKIFPSRNWLLITQCYGNRLLLIIICRSVCVCVCVEFREIVSKIQINNQMIHDERGQSNWLTWLFAFRKLRMRQKNNMHKICAVVRKFRCELLICIKWEIRIETKWKDGNIFPLSYHNHQSLWTSDSNICTIFHSLKYGNFICWIWWRWVYTGESPVLFSTDFFPVGIYSKKMNIPGIFAAASKWSNTNRAIGGMNERWEHWPHLANLSISHFINVLSLYSIQNVANSCKSRSFYYVLQFPAMIHTIQRQIKWITQHFVFAKLCVRHLGDGRWEMVQDTKFPIL